MRTTTINWLVLAGCVGLLTGRGVQAQSSASKPTTPVTTCVTLDCHGSIVAGKVLHAPTAAQKCAACHVLTNPARHLFKLTAEKRELCRACHVQTQRTVVHKPVADGDCTGCHSPHGSDYRFHLLGDPAGGVCARCHAFEQFQSKQHVHGPVAAGACLVCHEPHSSWHPKLLARSDKDLCLTCHEDIIARLQLARHAHPPVLAGECVKCHEPHASDHAAQLRTEPRELCVSCHEHDKIKALLAASSHVHGAVESEKSCTACHTGHGGALPKLLARPSLDLCLACHDESVTASDGTRLANMAALLRDNPDHHGPVRRADCSACHNPHASPDFRLLAKDYPEMFYAPFDLQNYDLCFTCHITEMVTAERGLGVTGFRAGEQNLHFLHVNQKKGRTCRACHEVHASRRPFHIREKVPFGAGGWEIEVNFEVVAGGGRCAPGCHEPKEYHRDAVRRDTTTQSQPKTEVGQ